MKESSIFKLALKEPKEPSVPRNIIRSEQSFERAGTLKLTKGDERKEKASSKEN